MESEIIELESQAESLLQRRDALVAEAKRKEREQLASAERRALEEQMAAGRRAVQELMWREPSDGRSSEVQALHAVVAAGLPLERNMPRCPSCGRHLTFGADGKPKPVGDNQIWLFCPSPGGHPAFMAKFSMPRRFD